MRVCSMQVYRAGESSGFRRRLARAHVQNCLVSGALAHPWPLAGREVAASPEASVPAAALAMILALVFLPTPSVASRTFASSSGSSANRQPSCAVTEQSKYTI